MIPLPIGGNHISRSLDKKQINFVQTVQDTLTLLNDSPEVGSHGHIIVTKFEASFLSEVRFYLFVKRI